ncbi:SMI1/KNR4 family protein [Tepidibacter sp. Z1-5]|uniref:SMI1/KNR4 family protein n=1 Tax=Tepidibacter sp. Z1-5 TaxID=3134138 RepID=UPI0030C60DB5
MNIKFEYTFKSIEVQDIEAFEKKYGFKLPNDYRQFLLLNNGGKTDRRKFDTKDENDNGMIISSIMLFCPLSDEVEFNLEKNYCVYNKEGKLISSKFLPIGIDPVENLICISVEGNNKGATYHCDMAYIEEDGILEMDCIRLISRNFTEFIENLYIA